MIHIFEDKTNKLSGNTSLFLSFSFNQDIINAIKASGSAFYNKTTRLWEVPVTSLSYLLDSLVYFDNIKLNVIEDDINKEQIKPILEYKTKPFPYQLDGITYGLNHDKWLLLDSPGLGKSLQTIYLAEELSAQRGLKHCLIVCGVATLRANWEKEIKKHSNKDSIIIGKKITSKGKVKWETIPKRAEQIRNKIDEFFIIINIETLRSGEVVEALKENVNEIDMIVLDEAHKCLSGDSLIETDKGTMRIEDIVNNKIKCKVKSFNGDKTEYKDVLDYHNYISTNLIELTIEKENKEIITIKCTPDHKIYTKNRGYVEAHDIKEDDILEIS
jgi:hypothetical protein